MIEPTSLRAPALLIAVPQLADPNFSRTVVLLIEHSEDGSMGIIMNKPLEIDIGDFCASQELSFDGDATESIYQGGPVQVDRAFILHGSDQEGPETETVLNDVRLSYSLESLNILVESPPDRLRIFLGYAGWGEGQLVDEITSGAWLVCNAADDLIFASEPEFLWEQALRRMGIEPAQLMHSSATH